MHTNKKRCFKVDKLIRDKVPDFMHLNGINVTKLIMEEKEYICRLKDKLVEEVEEVLEAKNREEMLDELADTLEILIALGKIHDASFADIETARVEKKKQKGGFEKRICIASIEMDSDNPRVDYYLKKPHKYPEIK